MSGGEFGHDAQGGRTTVVPKAKVWLEVDAEYAFGHGICRILEAVAETGSIKKAASSVGKSYRHVWSRIKSVEKTLGITLVETQVGGGNARRSSLTGTAEQLVEGYNSFHDDIRSTLESRMHTGLAAVIESAIQSNRSSSTESESSSPV